MEAKRKRRIKCRLRFAVFLILLLFFLLVWRTNPDLIWGETKIRWPQRNPENLPPSLDGPLASFLLAVLLSVLTTLSIWALESIPAIRGAVDALAETCVRKLYLPSFLQHPEKFMGSRLSDLDFFNEQFPFVGRKEELKQLHEFADHTPTRKLSWWWLTGQGGGGKSRLAFQWFKELSLRRDLDTGFYHDVGSNLTEWQPRRKTVVIVDNAATNTNALELVKTLRSREGELQFPVLILFIERLTSKLSNELPSKLHELDHNDYSQYRYSEVLHCKDFERSDITSLAKLLAYQKNERRLTGSQLQQIEAVSQGQALLAGIAAQAALAGDPILVREDLLFERARLHVKKLQDYGITETCQRSLAAATFARELRWEDAKALYEDGEGCNDDPNLYKNLFPTARLDRSLPTITPDSIGEAFVVETFEALVTEGKRERFLKVCWQANPQGVADSIGRIYQDFSDPTPPASEIKERLEENIALLDTPPNKLNLSNLGQATDHWILVSAQLLGFGTAFHIDIAIERLEKYMQANHSTGFSEQICMLVMGTAEMAMGVATNLQYIDGLSRSFALSRSMAGTHPENAAIQLELAKGAFNALNNYSDTEQVAKMDEAFRVLQEVASSHPENAAIQLELAKGAFNAHVSYSKTGRFIEHSEAWNLFVYALKSQTLSLLKTSIVQSGNNSNLAHELGGLYRFMGDCRQCYDLLPAMRAYKQTLHPWHPDLKKIEELEDFVANDCM